MEFNFIKIFGGEKTLIDVGLMVPDSVEKIILALSPDKQDRESINSSFGPWLETAAKDNCLIIAPCAPNGKLFHDGAEKMIPKMIEVFFTSLEQEKRKMAIVGIGSGTQSALTIANFYPELFTKLTLVTDKEVLASAKDLRTTQISNMKTLSAEQMINSWSLLTK